MLTSVLLKLVILFDIKKKQDIIVRCNLTRPDIIRRIVSLYQARQSIQHSIRSLSFLLEFKSFTMTEEAKENIKKDIATRVS